MLKVLLVIHIAAGSIALAAMWIPLVATKGGRLHRAGGWVFVAGMAVVSATALVLAGARALGPDDGSRAFGLFLFYVSILTAAGVSAGVRVLGARRRTAPHRHPWDLGLAALLTVTAVAMAVYGLAIGRTLFVAFSVIGLATGINQLVTWLRVPTHPMHWWFEHMGSMLGSCIAAVTAFVVVNADRWGLGTFSLVAWLAPSVIGTVAIVIWTGYYKRKFAGRGGPEGPRLRTKGPYVTAGL